MVRTYRNCRYRIGREDLRGLRSKMAIQSLYEYEHGNWIEFIAFIYPSPTTSHNPQYHLAQTTTTTTRHLLALAACCFPNANAQKPELLALPIKNQRQQPTTNNLAPQPIADVELNSTPREVRRLDDGTAVGVASLVIGSYY